MSKKKKKKQVPEKRFEDPVDELIRIMLITPGVTEGLLKNKDFVKEALLETRKAQKDKDDIKGLGNKYNLHSEEVTLGLAGVEELFTKILDEEF